jgi:L-rhamnose mutarotase
VFFPGQVQEIEAQQIYQISIFLKRANISLFLILEIPSGFPSVAPVITVNPPISHQWVNSRMQVTEHRQLSNWNGAFLLGNIIKDIELEFALRLPRLLNNSAENPTIQTLGMSGTEFSIEKYEFQDNFEISCFLEAPWNQIQNPLQRLIQNQPRNLRNCLITKISLKHFSNL